MISLYFTQTRVCFINNYFAKKQGDSGGPVVFADGDIHYQIGITSYNIPCATGVPDILARIPENEQGYDFIVSTVCDDWEELASFCGGNECSSDCDCSVGFECECDDGSTSSSSDDRRFLVEFQKQLMGHKSPNNQAIEDPNASQNNQIEEPAYTNHFAFPSVPSLRSIKDAHRRLKSGKSTKGDDDDSSSSCNSVKSCKSSKGDGPFCLSELFPDVPREV
jgi:hypothetical protein